MQQKLIEFRKEIENKDKIFLETKNDYQVPKGEYIQI